MEKLLSKTCKDIDFESALGKAHLINKMDLANNNFLKLYVVPICNKKLQYTKLEELLIDNINKFVFSRKINEDADNKSEIPKLTMKAVKKFKKIRNPKDCGRGGELGEFLLYIFLESDLKAYKLASKMEIKTSSEDYIKGADGFFLYENINNDEDAYQVIIGEAKVKANYNDAIKDAITSLVNHLENYESEMMLVSTELFKETFEEERMEKIKKILVPSSCNEFDVEKAFGVFIGYGLNQNILNKIESSNNKDAKKIIMESIEKDFKKICIKFEEEVKKMI